MNRLARIGTSVRGLSGWRRLLFAFAAGVVSATAFQPLGFFPGVLFGYAAVVLFIYGADAGPHPVRRAASAGWAFYFGQFFAGMHWIGYPFLVDPANHLWQMPLGLVALPAGLALFGVLACGLA